MLVLPVARKLLKAFHDFRIGTDSLHNLLKTLWLQVVVLDDANHLLLRLLLHLHQLGLNFFHRFLFFLSNFNGIGHLGVALAHHNLLKSLHFHIFFSEHGINLISHLLLHFLSFSRYVGKFL